MLVKWLKTKKENEKNKNKKLIEEKIKKIKLLFEYSNWTWNITKTWKIYFIYNALKEFLLNSNIKKLKVKNFNWKEIEIVKENNDFELEDFKIIEKKIRKSVTHKVKDNFDKVLETTKKVISFLSDEEKKKI